MQQSTRVYSIHTYCNTLCVRRITTNHRNGRNFHGIIIENRIELKYEYSNTLPPPLMVATL